MTHKKKEKNIILIDYYPKEPLALWERHCIAANPSKPIISSTTVGHSGEGCNPSMSLEIKDIPVQYYRVKHKVCWGFPYCMLPIFTIQQGWLRLVIMTKLESWKKTYNPVLFHLLNSSEAPLRSVPASFTRGLGHFWPSQHGDLGNHPCFPHLGSVKVVCPGSCNHQKVVISSPLPINTGSFKMDNCRFHLRSNCLDNT